jgi:serine/threonine protein phosphatase PrpC
MIDIGMASHEGGRERMEDFSCLERNGDNIFGGVFDGHGGPDVARIASKILPSLFFRKIKEGKTQAEAFREAYLEISDSQEFHTIGSTAVSFFSEGRVLCVANTGDSRMIMVIEENATQITTDHKLNIWTEEERILTSGGRIVDSHINGALNMTRSLGDRYLKDFGVIADPEIFTVNLPESKEIYLVAASDGLWEQLNNFQVANLIKEKSAQETTDALLNRVLEKNHDCIEWMDNITILVVKITEN